jgi:hypothetical protein
MGTVGALARGQPDLRSARHGAATWLGRNYRAAATAADIPALAARAGAMLGASQPSPVSTDDLGPSVPLITSSCAAWARCPVADCADHRTRPASDGGWRHW